MSGKITCCMVIQSERRPAVWWRLQGFPVPPEVPNNAIGEVRGGTVYFDWKPDPKLSKSLPSV